MSAVIHWFRRDLRIADNTALYHASQSGLPVIPTYILSSWKSHHPWTGPHRQHFLCGCLHSLSKNLPSLSGRLIIRQGDPIEQLLELAAQTHATAIHFNRDPDPFGKSIEAKLTLRCASLGIACHGHDDVSLHTPTEIFTGSAKPYKVFTPYFNNWITQKKPTPLPTPSTLATPPEIPSLPLPTVSHWHLETPTATLPQPGERAARDRMHTALSDTIPSYADHRDIPSLPGTSRLSQDLRHGLISIRTLFAKTTAAHQAALGPPRHSLHTYIKELAWRDFYFAILHHFPHVLHHEFNQDWKNLPWHPPAENFLKWKTGTTGFPIIDAGMRQLLHTGFIHNRVRMITAMFLTKDLHHDWKLGESHFMQHLTDGEIASNNGGWQWSAGTGADAAPYFRIQNPWSQTAKHDPHGLYIKQWIPELQHIDPKKFQAPPENNIPLAPGYPLPCIDHKTERDRTLTIFKNHRNSLPSPSP